MKFKALHKVLILLVRDIRTSRFFRPQFMITPLSFPIFFLYVGGFVYAGRLGDSYIPYTAILACGLIIAQMSHAGSISGSMLWLDRRVGMLEQLMACPFEGSHYFVAKYLSVLIQCIFSAVILIVISLPVLFNYLVISSLSIFYIGLSLAFGSLFFTAYYLLLSCVIKTPEYYRLIMTSTLFPMMFLSSAFYPIEYMPAPLSTLVLFNPLTYAADIIRAGLLGLSSPYLVYELILLPAISITLTLISFPFFNVKKLLGE